MMPCILDISFMRSRHLILNVSVSPILEHEMITPMHSNKYIATISINISYTEVHSRLRQGISAVRSETRNPLQIDIAARFSTAQFRSREVANYKSHITLQSSTFLQSIATDLQCELRIDTYIYTTTSKLRYFTTSRDESLPGFESACHWSLLGSMVSQLTSNSTLSSTIRLG